MSMPKRYNAAETEARLAAVWQDEGIHHFDEQDAVRPVYSIDTPPPTVSGHLHLGHVYSYSHPDFMARYFRMRGFNVFYPMGFDDNGLPTERLVEKRHGIRVSGVGREAFIQKCLEVSEDAEQDYRRLWQRLGLSIDWRHTYRTIDERSRRISQLSFLRFAREGTAYQKSAPAIWCPECRTSIAQAELNDLEAVSEFVTLAFQLDNGDVLPIATTRPELLAACVAVFVHPEDARYRALIGSRVITPLYNRSVPILADLQADPEKGTGAVMCCTFGDQTDVAWWNTHHLPLIEAIDRAGRMTAVTGDIAGLKITEARAAIKEQLEQAGLILGRTPTSHALRVHERCDTPVEYVVARQWFVRILDRKEELLAAGEGVRWHPDHMRARYTAWVENLNWDWCISRQRAYGVAIPAWYCKTCGAVMLADEASLPIDPQSQLPERSCECGCSEFEPETDVMDTWATSSLSPQIISGWLDDGELHQRTFPMSLRPQAHEIIRTWAFYTIVKSLFQFGVLPWKDVLISGWGLAGEGMGKISKSRGGGPMPPLEMIEKYSADAVRYWAASTSPGKDAVISEERIQMGAKLITKLWNVARFAEPFLPDGLSTPPGLSPADRWILARSQQLIHQTTQAMESYEYALAKSGIEAFFWRDLADNYIEMAKQRLYDPSAPGHSGAAFTLRSVLLTVIKLLAPFLPYVTDVIYRELFAAHEGNRSVHTAAWPQVEPLLNSQVVAEQGEVLVSIATAVRRYKSEQNQSLGAQVDRLQLAANDAALAEFLKNAGADLCSITRALQVEVVSQLENGLTRLVCDENTAIQVGIGGLCPAISKASD